MNGNIIINSTQNGEKIETVNRKCDFVETKKAYIVSYLEELYNNVITIDKKTNIVVVDKKSMSGEYYHSKLVFEPHKIKKCSINTREYSFFVDINAIKVIFDVKNERNIDLILKYYINDAYNEVNIKIEMLNAC